MEFLIVFGGIMVLIALGVRPHLQWEIEENTCNLEKEKKTVKTNKITFYSLVIGGPILILIGVLGVILL